MVRKLFDNQSYGSNAIELDLRREFDYLLFGEGGGVRHGHFILVRRFRRVNDDLVACTCKNNLTKEPSLDCSYCDGEGYLWDEHWTWCYSMYTDGATSLGMRKKYLNPGRLKVEYKTFFLRFDTIISEDDKIVEIVLDTEGRPVNPYKRKILYEISTLQEFRSDNGRLEYFAAHCRQDSAIKLYKG